MVNLLQFAEKVMIISIHRKVSDFANQESICWKKKQFFTALGLAIVTRIMAVALVALHALALILTPFRYLVQTFIAIHLNKKTPSGVKKVLADWCRADIQLHLMSILHSLGSIFTSELSYNKIPLQEKIQNRASEINQAISLVDSASPGVSPQSIKKFMEQDFPIRAFTQLVNEINNEILKTDNPDPDKIVFAKMCLEAGILKNEKYEIWKYLLLQFCGHVNELKSCPTHHYPLFKALVENLKLSALNSAEQTELKNQGLEQMAFHLTEIEFHIKAFAKVVLETGYFPSTDLWRTIIYKYDFDLWGEKQASLINIVLKYSNQAQREEILKDLHEWDPLKYIVQNIEERSYGMDPYINMKIKHYLNLPKLIALVEKKPYYPDPQARRKKIDEITQIVDATQKKYSTCRIITFNISQIREFLSTIQI